MYRDWQTKRSKLGKDHDREPSNEPFHSQDPIKVLTYDNYEKKRIHNRLRLATSANQ